MRGLALSGELHYPGYPAIGALPRASSFLTRRLSVAFGVGGTGRGLARVREGRRRGRRARRDRCRGPMAAAEAAAAPDPSGLSPKEEGELEDGEISDDDNNGFGPCGGGSERSGGLSSSSSRPYSRRRPPPGLHGSGSLSSPGRPFPRSRHQPPPDTGHVHGHGGYRPKDSFRSHPPAPRMPPGSHSDTGPRLSFWERSHNALDRFRFRGRPYRGGGRWGRSRGCSDRPGNPPGRPPGGGGSGGFSSSQGWREPSPRKCILGT